MADPEPTPSTDPLPKILPLVGPVLALLKGRKGVVLLGAIAFCTVVYLRNPAALDRVLAFLTIVLPAYFAAQAYEDAQAKKLPADQSSTTTVQVATPTAKEVEATVDELRRNPPRP